MRFLAIANGSLRELTTCLEIAQALRYVTGPDLERANALSDETRRMLIGLRASLQRKTLNPES